MESPVQEQRARRKIITAVDLGPRSATTALATHAATARLAALLLSPFPTEVPPLLFSDCFTRSSRRVRSHGAVLYEDKEGKESHSCRKQNLTDLQRRSVDGSVDSHYSTRHCSFVCIRNGFFTFQTSSIFAFKQRLQNGCRPSSLFV